MDSLGDNLVPGRGFRRLSLTISIAGLVALISTAASISSRGIIPQTYSAFAASLLFLGSNLFFYFVRHPQPWMPIAQAVEVAIIGLLSAVLSDASSFGGIVLFAVSVPLFAKQGVIRTRGAMLLLVTAAVIVDTVLSYLLHGAPLRLVVGMSAISVGIYSIVYYAFYDEIISLLKDVSVLRRTAAVSEHNLHELRRNLARARITHDSARTQAEVAEERVRDLEQQVGRFEAVTSPVEIDQFGLSEREIDVLRTLVEIRGRNRDVGAMLGITERTVKSHIYGICNKVGVDTRLELVELFRWNWPQGEPVDDPM